MARADSSDPERTRVALVDPLVGTILDRRYRVEFRLAAGGFGAIYRATHVITGRDVALKILHAGLTTDRAVVARFRREGVALASLRDPHTIRVFDLGEAPDGTLYLVMELLQGESLYERFCGLGPLPWRRVVAIARAACRSLAEAHALGIVHRDLTPSNIHLERVGRDPDFVKVLDFGIAKILHGSALDAADLTHTGQMIGTFDYMAPEQIVGGVCTGQTDIYTLGVVMYEMIGGARPFGEPTTAAEMLTAILAHEPAPLSSRSDAPAELDPIVARCLDRDRERRFADVHELAAELDRVLAAAADATKTRVTQAPASGDDARTAVIATPAPGDDATWIDGAPGMTRPGATLPGVMAPSPGTPWPLNPTRRR